MDDFSAGLTREVIGAAMVVHSELGAGLLESHYHDAMEVVLGEFGIPFATKVPCPVVFRGKVLSAPKQIDLLVGGSVVVELKSATAIQPWHVAQALTYMRLSRCETGLILNFNVASMRHGIKRLTISPRSSVPSVSSVAEDEAGEANTPGPDEEKTSRK